MSKSLKSPVSSKKSTSPNNDLDADDDIITTDHFVALPPDGGWGWVIVTASFLSNFVADGTLYTFGMFMIDISTSLNCHPTDVVIANSLMAGFFLLLGPLTCGMVNRYGFRVIGFCGGVLGGLVLLATSAVSSLTLFCVIYGFFGGLSIGMIYVPSIVIIGFYFERWRALATSIAACGSSIGILLFPMLISGLLKTYSWRTKFQILAIAMFSCSLFALFYLPLHPVLVVDPENRRILMLTDPTVSFRIENDKGFLRRLFNRLRLTKHNSSTFTNIIMMNSKSSVTSLSSMFVMEINKDISLSRMTVDSSQQESQSQRLYPILEDSQNSWNEKHKRCYKFCHAMSCKCCLKRQQTIAAPSRPMYREDVFFTGSLATLPEYSRSTAASIITPRVSAKISTFVDYHLSVTRQPTLRDIEEEKYHCVCCPEAIQRTIVTMLGFSLLKSPSFLLLSISGALSLLGMYIPFMYTVDRAKHINISEQTALYLLPTLGVSNCVGRMLCGVLPSIPHFKALSITYISLIICGTSTAFSIFFNTVYGQFAYMIVFGITVACLATLKSIILVDLLGLEKLTNAFGIIMLFQGFATFIGGSIAGKIAKATNTYDYSFIFAGIALLLSGLLLIPIEKLSKREKQQQQEL